MAIVIDSEVKVGLNILVYKYLIVELKSDDEELSLALKSTILFTFYFSIRKRDKRTSILTRNYDITNATGHRRGSVAANCQNIYELIRSNQILLQ